MILNQLENIIIKLDGVNIYSNILLPEVKETENDIYVRTVKGDRMDLLAYQYYEDTSLWKVIAIANPDIVRKDSIALNPGLTLRLPSVEAVNEFLLEINRINA